MKFSLRPTYQVSEGRGRGGSRHSKKSAGFWIASPVRFWSGFHRQNSSPQNLATRCPGAAHGRPQAADKNHRSGVFKRLDPLRERNHFMFSDLGVVFRPRGKGNAVIGPGSPPRGRKTTRKSENSSPGPPRCPLGPAFGGRGPILDTRTTWVR